MEAPSPKPQLLPAFAWATALHLLGAAVLWFALPSPLVEPSEPPLQVTVVAQAQPALPVPVLAAAPKPISAAIAAPAAVPLPASSKAALEPIVSTPTPTPVPSPVPALSSPQSSPSAVLAVPTTSPAPVALPITVVAPATVAAPAPTTSARSDIGIACPVQVKPVMPSRAIAEGVSGTVVAQALIKDGAVKQVTIVSGPTALRAAVRSAMLQYQCVADSAEVLAVQSFTFKVE